MPKSLGVGQRAPGFSLLDQAGCTRSLQEFLGHPLVVFFYPKDDTRVCTEEACAFRDEHAAFAELGAQVIGVSHDTVATHQAFAARYRLPYTLLSDPRGELRKAWGVPNVLLLLPGRVTYVLDPEGIVLYVYKAARDGAGHAAQALQVLRGTRGA